MSTLDPYAAAQSGIDRRRLMALALQRESMAPIVLPQVRGARVSPLEGISKIAQSLLGQYQNAGLDQEQQALAGQEQQSRLAQALSLSNQVVPQTPGDTTPPPVSGLPLPELAPSAPPTIQEPQSVRDTRDTAVSSLAKALSSSDPTMRDAGKTLLQSLLTGSREEKTQAAEMARQLAGQDFTAGQQAKSQQFTAGENAANRAQPRYSFEQGGPGQAQGIFNSTTGGFQQTGTTPIPERPAPNVQNQTVDTAEGVMQFNPATGKYDIRVGSVKPTAQSTREGMGYADLNPKDKERVDAVAAKVAAGEYTISNGLAALGGVRGGLGGALTESLSDDLVLPTAIRTANTDIERAKNLLVPVHKLVDEINSTKDISQKVVLSARLDQYVQAIGTQFARAKGERGVVTDKDVSRVLGLIPGWKSANFAPQYAKDNLALVEEAFTRDQSALLGKYFTKFQQGGAPAGNAPAKGGGLVLPDDIRKKILGP